MNETPTYVLERTFAAPRELVWRVWTDPELIPRWYGPNVETIVHKYELVPDGEWLGEMKMGEQGMRSKAVFKEIVPPSKLLWHESSADDDWQVMANPRMPDWPTTVATLVTFAGTGAQTHLQLRWSPVAATAAEAECFAGAIANMSGGWTSGFNLIDELLIELQS